MQQHEKASFLIAGAGPTGLYLAIAIARQGHNVTVLERHHKSVAHRSEGGRSINFTLSYRGLEALRALGLEKAVKEVGIPVVARAVHLDSGEVWRQKYGSSSPMLSITRSAITEILNETLKQYQNVTVEYSSALVSVDLLGKQALVETETVDQHKRSQLIEYDFIIGAEGANSKVRDAIINHCGTKYDKEYFPWKYKAFPLGAEDCVSLQLEKGAVHLWPTKDSLLIGLPNLDGSFSFDLLLSGPCAADDKLSKFISSKAVENAFGEVHHLVGKAIKAINSCSWSTFATSKVETWYFKDSAVLVGDSAHTFTHFYAQGLNAGLEDAATLLRSVNDFNKCSGITMSMLRGYQEARKPNTDVMGRLSKEHFQTLHKHCRRSLYFARHIMESFMNRVSPRLWQSQYHLVVHTNTPYASVVGSTKKRRLLWYVSGLSFCQYLIAAIIFSRSTIRRLRNLRQSKIQFMKSHHVADSY